jgi:hypothetical protein
LIKKTRIRAKIYFLQGSRFLKFDSEILEVKAKKLFMILDPFLNMIKIKILPFDEGRIIFFMNLF